MVEGARLESVFRGNSNVGSNPTLSAKVFRNFLIIIVRYRKIRILNGFRIVRVVDIATGILGLSPSSKIAAGNGVYQK